MEYAYFCLFQKDHYPLELPLLAWYFIHQWNSHIRVPASDGTIGRNVNHGNSLIRNTLNLYVFINFENL